MLCAQRVRLSLAAFIPLEKIELTHLFIAYKLTNCSTLFFLIMCRKTTHSLIFISLLILVKQDT